MAIGHDGRTVYFCIDIEASGPVPQLYNMVSLGAVEVRWDGKKHVRGREFYIEITPAFDGFDAHAMSIHGLSRAHLEANGVESKAAMAQLTDFVQSCCTGDDVPLFVGHNAPFDWMYVAWYFAWAGMKNPFGYNALDTKALTMGRQQWTWKRCSKPDILKAYPHLEAPDPETEHDALVDAKFQADILIALLDS